MATVYLDASFVSACVTDREDPKSVARRQTSREWWSAQQHHHEVYISQEVIRELSHPAFRQRREALSWIGELPLLEITDEVSGAAQVFVREFLMPRPAVGDAIHVAVCTVHRIEYLVTWNVRHLANPAKLMHLQSLCRRIGLVPPQIVTPEFLWEA